MGARVRFVGVGKNIPADQMNSHKKSFPLQAREVIRVSDIILEVLDARYIEETRNLEIEKEILDKGKKIIYVLNKADLVDVKELVRSGVLKNLRPYVLVSCKTNIGRTKLRDIIKIEVKRLRRENALLLEKSQHEKLILAGKQKELIMKAENRAQVGIIGYPNTGKSTLTNILSGRGAANASANAGFTKGIQKIRFTKDILILDTPGLIRESENSTYNSQDLKKHYKIGVRTYDSVKEPEYILDQIVRDFPGKIEKHYELEESGDSELILDTLGRKWGFINTGNTINRDKTARRILKAWQENTIKR